MTNLLSLGERLDRMEQASFILDDRAADFEFEAARTDSDKALANANACRATAKEIRRTINRIGSCLTRLQI